MNFEIFSEKIMIAIHFENMSSEEIEIHLHDLYVEYDKDLDFLTWIKSFMSTVSRDTHSYWIDHRGVKILEIEQKIQSIGPKDIFPVCGSHK